MGGGPVEGDDDVEFILSPQRESIPEVVVTNEALRSAFSAPPATSPPHVVVNTAEHERPILSSMAAGGVLGGLVGSMLGMGSVMGSLSGALVGASVASRDDAIGANTRKTVLDVKTNFENTVSKAFERLNEEPIGRDLTEKVSSALQLISETGEKYRVSERVEFAFTKAVQVAEPKVRLAMEKVVEADKHGYIGKATSVLQKVDKTMGFTRSVDAISRELR